MNKYRFLIVASLPFLMGAGIQANGKYDGNLVAGNLTLGALPSIANTTFLCNVSGISATPTACSASQVKTGLAISSSDVSGLGTLATLNSVNNSNWSGTALAIGNGGTSQTTATAAFDALSPLTTSGDILYYNGTHNVRLAKGTDGQYLSLSGGLPVWAAGGGGGGGAGSYTTLYTLTGVAHIDQSNTSFTSLLSGGGNGSLSTALSAGDTILIDATGIWTTNVGGTWDLEITKNGTVVIDTQDINGGIQPGNGFSGQWWSMHLEITMVTSTTFNCTGHIDFEYASSVTVLSPKDQLIGNVSGLGTTISAANNAFDMKAKMNGATATSTWYLTTFRLSKVASP